MEHVRHSLLASLLILAGCTTVSYPPIAVVPKVDLPRFMGDWYVIANIPTFIEKGAHNAVESYRLAEDGTIETTFTFRANGFDGHTKTYTPRGFVFDRESNAVWGMQFIWPFKADFRIVYLTPDYTQTVIAREARDYVWIMARTPEIPEADYRRILAFLKEQGYDISQIQKVPQRWESRETGHADVRSAQRPGGNPD
ncbi:MAG: lipocalin family protein [Pseudomonadota bacterium]|nr:MAG: lipocalin family protein [Pseudomonadota bacterium]